MISIPDELKAMVDDYNKKHMFKKLHISEICQEAIYLAVTGEACSNVPVANNKDNSEKPVIPCPICGELFVQTKSTRKFCSKNCGTTASKRRNKAE